MVDWFRLRYLDLLASIYIYNEHRGYTAIDRVLEAVRVRSPDDHELIGAIEQHRVDERNHYVMFRRWFELRGTMPLELDRKFGHIDRFIEIMFGRSIDRLDTQAVVERDDLFERLCRVIALTERRGYRQLEVLLANKAVLSDPVLTR
ncbi:MAG: ferritin-like domain-containing protein, partial [Croceibacterium sp.]